MNLIYSVDYSKKELQAIAMRKRMVWMLFILMCGVAAYGWAVFLLRNL